MAIAPHNGAEPERAVAVGGQIALIGVLTGFASTVPSTELMAKQARIQGLIVGSREQQQDMVRALNAWGCKPVIDRSFALAHLADAFAYQQAGQHVGKITVTV